MMKISDYFAQAQMMFQSYVKPYIAGLTVKTFAPLVLAAAGAAFLSGRWHVTGLVLLVGSVYQQQAITATKE